MSRRKTQDSVVDWSAVRDVARELAGWKHRAPTTERETRLMQVMLNPVRGLPYDDRVTVRWRREWARRLAELDSPDFVETARALYDDSNPVTAAADVAEWIWGAPSGRLTAIRECGKALESSRADAEAIGSLVLEAMRQDRRRIVDVFHESLLVLAKESAA